MSRRRPEPGTLKFILIAVFFMVIADHFLFGGLVPGRIKEAEPVPKTPAAVAHIETPKPAPVYVQPENGADYFEQLPMEEPVPAKEAEKEISPPQDVVTSPKPMPAPVEKAAPLPKIRAEGRPKIAIVIDDLGMDVKHTKQVIDLPAGVTLAFLPYAPQVRSLAADGKAKGHDLIIHVPMEAMDASLNIGPGGLKEGMSNADMTAAFDTMTASFDGYDGINNHMGSRLTQDKDKMDALMAVLKEKGLFFLDSKTVASSVAAQEAASHGVKYAERDVFLDHVETPDFVHKALSRVEDVARRDGSAIAIGHPKPDTIAALRAWLPTLEAKGFELVPVKSLLRTPKMETPVVAKTEEPPAPPPIDMFPEDPVRVPADITPSADVSIAPVQPPDPPPTQLPAP